MLICLHATWHNHGYSTCGAEAACVEQRGKLARQTCHVGCPRRTRGPRESNTSDVTCRQQRGLNSWLMRLGYVSACLCARAWAWRKPREGRVSRRPLDPLLQFAGSWGCRGGSSPGWLGRAAPSSPELRLRGVIVSKGGQFPRSRAAHSRHRLAPCWLHLALNSRKGYACVTRTLSPHRGGFDRW